MDSLPLFGVGESVFRRVFRVDIARPFSVDGLDICAERQRSTHEQQTGFRMHLCCKLLLSDSTID